MPSRSVILDKSFLQAEDKSCRNLRALQQCRCNFILTDALIYELCTASRDTMWAEAQQKLFKFADCIEVWRHTGELLKEELDKKKPIAHPRDENLTTQTRDWFSCGSTFVPANLRSSVETAKQQREEDSVESLIKMCRTFCKIYSEQYHQIRHDVAQDKNCCSQIDSLVNNEEILKCWFRLKHGNPVAADVYLPEAEEGGLGPKWFAYHHTRSCLALWGDFMLKYGANGTPGREFRNTKLDADYVALLNYADALATNESIGSMTNMCTWLYHGSRKMFSTQKMKAVLPNEDVIRLEAFFVWDRGDRTHGHALNDWLSAECALMAQVWDRLS